VNNLVVFVVDGPYIAVRGDEDALHLSEFAVEVVTGFGRQRLAGLAIQHGNRADTWKCPNSAGALDAMDGPHRADRNANHADADRAQASGLAGAGTSTQNQPRTSPTSKPVAMSCG
jgi:hypothetical protein